MTVLQNQNPCGILVFRDELTGLLVRWDREDGQDERAYFLEGWNGNGLYTDCIEAGALPMLKMSVSPCLVAYTTINLTAIYTKP